MSGSMKSSRIAVLAVVLLALTIVPFVSDDTDAMAVINNGDGQVSWDFDNMDGGYIRFSVNNLDGSFTMDVTVYEGDDVVATLEGVRVAANSVTEVTVDSSDGWFEVGVDDGLYAVKVHVTAVYEYFTGDTYTVNAKLDIWLPGEYRETA